MAKRLTDKKRKAIIADYVITQNYREVARKHKVSATTVKRLVLNDPEMARKSALKKEANTQDILAYMDTQKDVVCKIIYTYLAALLDADKIANANPAQLTTAMGTVIDKFTSIEKQSAAEDELIKAQEIMRGVSSAIK